MVHSTASSYAFSVNISSDTWFADSGASDHMTDRREWFSTFQFIPEGRHAVQIADNTHIWVTGKGNIKILLDSNGRQVNSILKNVLYVPHLKLNIFSVGAASKRNMSFMTFPGRCEFRDPYGKILLQGIRLHNLYQLSFQVISPSVISQATICATTTMDPISNTGSHSHHSESELWHHRMGHVNYLTLNQMCLNVFHSV